MKTKEKEEGAAFVLRQCFLCASRARGELSAFPFSFSIERRGRFRLRKRPPLYYFILFSSIFYTISLLRGGLLCSAGGGEVRKTDGKSAGRTVQNTNSSGSCGRGSACGVGCGTS